MYRSGNTPTFGDLRSMLQDPASRPEDALHLAHIATKFWSMEDEVAHRWLPYIESYSNRMSFDRVSVFPVHPSLMGCFDGLIKEAQHVMHYDAHTDYAERRRLRTVQASGSIKEKAIDRVMNSLGGHSISSLHLTIKNFDNLMISGQFRSLSRLFRDQEAIGLCLADHVPTIRTNWGRANYRHVIDLMKNLEKQGTSVRSMRIGASSLWGGTRASRGADWSDTMFRVMDHRDLDVFDLESISLVRPFRDSPSSGWGPFHLPALLSHEVPFQNLINIEFGVTKVMVDDANSWNEESPLGSTLATLMDRSPSIKRLGMVLRISMSEKNRTRLSMFTQCIRDILSQGSLESLELTLLSSSSDGPWDVNLYLKDEDIQASVDAVYGELSGLDARVKVCGMATSFEAGHASSRKLLHAQGCDTSVETIECFDSHPYHFI